MLRIKKRNVLVGASDSVACLSKWPWQWVMSDTEEPGLQSSGEKSLSREQLGECGNPKDWIGQFEWPDSKPLKVQEN